MLLFDYLQVDEVVGKIESGMTEPYRCRLEDDRLYALKGRQALSRGLIAEAVCAKLGHRLNLPIPDSAIASVDSDLIAASEDKGFGYAIGEGMAFASLWRDSTIPINRSWIERADRSTLARIYVFDHWVLNGDRTLTELGGNPNLLIDLASGELVVIDHNLAFSTDYDPTELEVHACRQAWVDERQILVFNEQCRAAMEDSLTILPELFESLPREWRDATPDIEDEILNVLQRIETTQFWDELA